MNLFIIGLVFMIIACLSCYYLGEKLGIAKTEKVWQEYSRARDNSMNSREPLEFSTKTYDRVSMEPNKMGSVLVKEKK